MLSATDLAKKQAEGAGASHDPAGGERAEGNGVVGASSNQAECEQGSPLLRLGALITRLVNDAQAEAGAAGAQRNEIAMRRLRNAAEDYQLIQRLLLEARAQCRTAGVPFSDADSMLSQASELANDLLHYHADDRDRELARVGELMVQYRSVGQRLLELRAWCENADRTVTSSSDAQAEQGKEDGAGSGQTTAERAEGCVAESERWLTVSEAARISACNKGIITRAVEAGTLKSNGKAGRLRRIDAVDLARWQLARAAKPEPTENDASVEPLVKKHVHD
jgi:hypothetical protein